MKHNIQVHPTKNPRLPNVDVNNVPFGKAYSDHMFMAEFKDGAWQDPRIVPFGDLSLSPANLALHYGQSIFEGMKASKDAEGTPLLFRMDAHITRLNNSAKRMDMPEFPAELFYEAIRQLVNIDHGWIPDSPSSLYIRPLMFALDPYIGVRSSTTYQFLIFTGPVSSYYTKPVKLITAQHFIRAAKGGVGAAKTAGNYAATLYPMKLAYEQGYDQIMWMSPDFKYIQECGTMNLFFVIGDTIITPANSNKTILGGITKDCFLTILRDAGHKVEERDLSIDEVVNAYHKGELKDVFGSGTAAVVAAISEITYKDLTMVIPPLETRKTSIFLKEELTAIRAGERPDKFNWIEKLKVKKHVTT